MSQRLVGGLLLVLLVPALLVGTLGGPAGAVEATEGPVEHGPAPSIDEIGTQNEVSREFLPEEQEAPAFFRFFSYPLIITGVLVTALVMLAYLVWQPRFAEERRSRRRR